MEWVLFGLRLLATFILYIFLGVAFYLIWRQLRHTEAQQTTATKHSVDQLRVIATDESQTLVTGQTLLLPPAMVLGRDPQNSIVVNPADSLVGQVRLSRRDEHWWLENLGDPEQIKLNQALFSETQRLSHGDVISIGDTQFRFETAQ